MRDYFPQPREATATRPADDAPTFCAVVASIVFADRDEVAA